MSDMLGQSLGKLARPMKDFMEKVSGFDAEHWIREFNKFLRKKPTWTYFPATVNYDIPVQDIVVKSKPGLCAPTGTRAFDTIGKFVAEGVFSHTMRSGIARLELRILQYHCEMKRKRVLASMEEQGLRAAELCELLSVDLADILGSVRYQVYALGSVGNSPGWSKKLVPYEMWDEHGHILWEDNADDLYSQYALFLAVKL